DIAVLWLEGPRNGRVESVANLPAPARDAPFTQWTQRACAHIARRLRKPAGSGAEAGAIELSAGDLPEGLGESWSEFLPPFGLWVPLHAPGGERLGGLLLGRGRPWLEPEKRVLGRTGE